MWEESKIKNYNNSGKLLKEVFIRNWKREFLYDSINNNILTYQNFFSEIIELKEKLQEFGLKKKDVLCLLMDNSVDEIELYFAGLLLQLVVVPLDPERGRFELHEILDSLNPKLVITNVSDHEHIKNKIDSSSIKSGMVVREDLKNQLSLFDKVDFEEDFLLTFTSGSTGNPKGVVHSFNNLVKTAVAFKKKFHFGNKNIFFHNFPMSYMAGILNLIILPLICESRIVVSERFTLSSVMNFWNIPIKYSVNTFWFTPTMIGLLLKFDRGVDGINYTKKNEIIGCVATAPLNPQSKNEFEAKYEIKLYDSYGLSETLFVSTNSPSIETDGVGELLDGVGIKFDEKEILIDVPWMFKRYYNLKKENFVKNGRFVSGDLGEMFDKKLLKITGRKKDLIIKGGINISPKKIEDFIGSLKIFDENVVLGFPDKIMGEKVVCFIITKSSSAKEQKFVNKQITEKLGRDYHIDEFIELEDMPKTVNGKIDKPKIRENYLKNK